MSRMIIGVLTLLVFPLAGCTTGYQLPAAAITEDGGETYAWCADLGLDGTTNCGFVTLEQCRAAIAGIGGQCYPNPGRGIASTTQPPARDN